MVTTIITVTRGVFRGSEGNRKHSQRCDLDELSQQLDPLGQRLTLQDLRGNPVLYLTAALQYQLQVQGAPSSLLPVKHVTHELHLHQIRSCFSPSQKKKEEEVMSLTSCTQLKSSQSKTTS